MIVKRVFFYVLGMMIVLWNFPLFASGAPQNQQDLMQDQVFRTAVDEVADLRLSLFGFRQQLGEIDKAEKQKKNGRLDQKYKEVRSEMVKVIQDIDNSSMRISKLLQQLYQYKQDLTSELSLLQTTRQHLEIGKQYLSQLLVLVYKMQRELYDEQGEEIDELKLFMKSNAMPQLLAWNDTLQVLLLQINDLLKQASLQEKEKSELVARLTALKAATQKTLARYTAEINTLQQKKVYLTHFMALYNQKKLDSMMASGFVSEFQVFNDRIGNLVAEILEAQHAWTFLYSGAWSELVQLARVEDQSPLAWPAYPVGEILRIFKDPEFEQEYGVKHLGLQLALAQGTPVYAMRDGVVYHREQLSGSVHWLLIAHTDGYISSYAYMNEIAVQPWTLVRRGQFIGQSGGEQGTQWAGFSQQSPNLTFQIFKDGVAIDPLTVLDLSVVVDKQKVLPEEYRLKYFNDHYVRPIDVSELALIKGDTVDQRSQTFLNRYAVGVYRDLPFWDQVVAGTNIDRDMVICIAFAESTLGKFLSTSNNIWNVGNNDRGDRIAYDNPYNGARLIPLTLNNQYLWGYHTIKQLSRYGNSDGKIYASSPINWQSNVQKCLSKIKGYYIPEDFPFRTGVVPHLKTSPQLANEQWDIMGWARHTKRAGVPVEQP